MSIKTSSHYIYMRKIQENDDVLVCTIESMSLFPDNLQGACDDCGCDLYYRPYNSRAIKKICIKCAIIRMNNKDMK